MSETTPLSIKDFWNRCLGKAPEEAEEKPAEAPAKPKTDPEPKPKTDPKPKPEPKPKTDPKPKPEPKPKTDPKPKPKTDPATKPADSEPPKTITTDVTSYLLRDALGESLEQRLVTRPGPELVKLVAKLLIENEKFREEVYKMTK